MEQILVDIPFQYCSIKMYIYCDNEYATKKLIKTGQMVDDRNANIAALTNGQQLAGILIICASCNIK